jgi:serine/threonine protein kinase
MHPDQPASQALAQDNIDINVDDYLSEDLPTDFSEQAAGTAVAEEQSQTQAGAAAPGPAGAPLPPAAVPGPGTVLRDRFVLQAQMGGGNMGQVYKALDRRRQESADPEPWVAIKLVQPAPGQHPQAREALHQEAQLAQRLSHPNIVRIFDVDRDGDSSFLVMEWLEGESLARFLDGRRWRPLPRLQALQIVEGICRALAYAHGQGIVHADVKPGNIFLAADGATKLLDFGVAQLTDEQTGEPVPALVCGHTPEYASPEVIEGEVPAAADDLFSLACVAYRMLAGKRAFGRQNALEAEAAGLRPERIEHMPPAQWQALDQALAFRRADRPADVNAFIASLKGPRDDVASTAERDPDAALEATAEELALEVAREEGSNRGSGLRWAVAAAATLAVAAILAVAQRPAGEPRTPAPVAGPPPVAAPVLTPVEPPLPAMPPADPVALPEAAVASWPEAAVEVPAGVEPAIDAGLAAEPAPDAAAQQDGAVLARPTPAEADPVMQSVPEPVPPAVPRDLPPPAPASLPTADIPQVVMSDLRFRRYVEPRFFREGLPAVSGWVDIGFTVEADGRTSGVKILGGEPGGYWADTAAQAVRRWQFQPVARDGEGTAVRSEVRLRFAPDLPEHLASGDPGPR